MPRYFYSELANRPYGSVIFEKTAIIGSNICGIYATDDPRELALLDGAISQRAGVIEISQEEYAQQQAQKKTTLNSVPSLTLRPVPQQAPPQHFQINQDKPGVESVASPEAQKSSEIKQGKVEDPRSVIKLDKVASPGFVEEGERMAPVAQSTRRKAKAK
jgi:hypothetical protein